MSPGSKAAILPTPKKGVDEEVVGGKKLSQLVTAEAKPECSGMAPGHR